MTGYKLVVIGRPFVLIQKVRYQYILILFPGKQKFYCCHNTDLNQDIFFLIVFWNFSLPAKRKSSACISITPISDLFSSHVNIEASISDTFPLFDKTNALI